MKTLYRVFYTFTETYCSPNEENWEKQRKHLFASYDKEQALEFLSEQNKDKSFFDNKYAEIEEISVSPTDPTALNLIEKALAKAVKADPNDAPFGMSPEEAAFYHKGQREAYQYALEMLG